MTKLMGYGFLLILGIIGILYAVKKAGDYKIRPPDPSTAKSVPSKLVSGCKAGAEVAGFGAVGRASCGTVIKAGAIGAKGVKKVAKKIGRIFS